MPLEAAGLSSVFYYSFSPLHLLTSPTICLPHFRVHRAARVSARDAANTPADECVSCDIRDHHLSSFGPVGPKPADTRIHGQSPSCALFRCAHRRTRVCIFEAGQFKRTARLLVRVAEHRFRPDEQALKSYQALSHGSNAKTLRQDQNREGVQPFLPLKLNFTSRTFKCEIKIKNKLYFCKRKRIPGGTF